MRLQVNGNDFEVDVEPEEPLLWILRDKLALTGTKYGCGRGLCGACTVHVDGKPVRSCSTTATAVEGKSITTIEGLSQDGNHPVQRAWLETDVSQCGYCQTGQIMTAAALLAEITNPSDDQIDEAMYGNLCRCGTYPRIRTAIKSASQKMGA